MALVNDAIENRNVQILDNGKSSTSVERHGTMSTNLSDKKSRNDHAFQHDSTISSNGDGLMMGS